MTVLYAATLFLGSTLLFLVQPMVGKMLLPTLGGTPAVWNTCMMFFQAALLAGYAYAHAATTWLGVRRQAAVHAIVLLVPLAVLPIAAAGDAGPATLNRPNFWLLQRLLISVGLPFFVVATGAPLLQRWFAATGHPAAGDPYFLYTASNIGSMVALLSYPVLIEPYLPLAEQSRYWTAAYGALVVMVWACAIALWRSGGRARPPRPAGRAEDGGRQPLTASRRGLWLLLAFAPSSLMLGVTTHISTNLAAVPLLWVVPLAIYLLTFAMVFARKPLLSTRQTSRLLPFVAILSAPLVFATVPGLEWQAVVAHLVMLFVAAMVCHGRLADSRPGPGHLTEYYLWISVGGVLGGVFNAIVAPSIFTTVAEYPLALVLACLLRPPAVEMPNTRTRGLDFLTPAVLCAGTVALVFVLNRTAWAGTWAALAAVFVIGAGVSLAVRRRPLRFGLCYGATLLSLAVFTRLGEGRLLHIERDFFGVKRIVASADGGVRTFYHGTTVHGIQQTNPAYAEEPLAYYHRSGPIGDIFRAAQAKGQAQRVAVVGLGVGATACYAEPGQDFTFYEIDPAVARIAADPAYFTYLAKCRGRYEVVLGDGRLTLAGAPDGAFGLILLDAYNSDAIPTHLLSREAVRLYRSKLAAGGLLAFHMTNRYLNLEPLLARLAADAGWACRARSEGESEIDEAAQAMGATPAEAVVMARTDADLGILGGMSRWRRPRVRADVRVWTDQYSSILSVLRRGS